MASDRPASRNLQPPATALRLTLCGLVVASALAGFALAESEAVREVPPLAGHINDHAGIVADDLEERLGRLLANVEAAHGPQIAVLTLPSLAGEELERYSLRVARTWALGRPTADDGVLFLVAMAERQARLEVGRGLEEILTDDEARQILDEAMTARFRAGDYGGGVEAVLEAVIAEVTEGSPAVEALSATAATAATLSGLEVTYLANEGFLVTGGGKRILVDALFGAGVSGYDRPPAALLEKVERGAGELGGVDLALASHVHPDHFDADSVRRFLAANPRATFLSTPQAVEAAARAGAPRGRMRAELPDTRSSHHLLFDGFEVTVLNLHHGRASSTQNLGFIIHLNRSRALHFGDTEATLEDFEPYLRHLRGVDVALLPFWFCASDWRVKMVREEISPRWVVVAHLPQPDAGAGFFGRWQTYDNLLSTIRANFPRALIPERPGQRLTAPAESAR